MEKTGKIKIMHFVHSLNEGGIERLLLEICSKINKDNFEIQICCLVEKGFIYPEFEKIGIKLHFVKAKRDFNLWNIIPNLFVMIKIIKLLKREQISITHGHEFFSTVFSRIASVSAGVKKRYITLHNSYTWWSSSVHNIQKLLSRITTRIICNSKATLNYSLCNDKIDKEKYLLIYNGIDCNKFSKYSSEKEKLLSELGIKGKKYVCMSVGSISSRKGFEYLIKAAVLLKEDNPDIIYLIIGDKHLLEYSEYDKITSLIKELKLKETVIITGNRNDVDKILNCCDLFLMPSVVEGFGLALVEAMAVENVCVASDIEPFREIIEDGKDGILVRAENETALANKIKEVRRMDSFILDQIKLNARRKITDKFNSERMVKEYEELYSGN